MVRQNNELRSQSSSRSHCRLNSNIGYQAVIRLNTSATGSVYRSGRVRRQTHGCQSAHLGTDTLGTLDNSTNTSVFDRPLLSRRCTPTRTTQEETDW
ncbi:hypothetical protein AVEN_89396-1 [Araneus ventricosus]|uniref:Uncharacterized protein n=1 Tax=Araneus ventricosus TaxID=182803 RepID=A0A4Y2V6K4_ARAVE|nr:hypothetical protein AVEN_89396-1 [Araneus ventricosus]